jgi:hypothetical protein
MQGLFFRQDPAQFVLVSGAIHGPKADVREARHTVPIDDHAGRHALDLEALGRFTLWIETDVEVRMEFRQEPLGVLAMLIEIDGNHRQTTARVGILHCLHPWK